ncbi:MAG: hypothetical protein U1E70_13080 [Acetobacteraceae bacterium]
MKLQGLVARSDQDRPALLEEALRIGHTAVALDGQDCMNLCVVGRMYASCTNLKRPLRTGAVAEGESELCTGLFRAGIHPGCQWPTREGLPYLERSVELSPYDPHLSSIFAIRALGHMALNEMDKAECFARKATRIPNTNRWPLLVQAALLGQMGRRRKRAGQLLRFLNEAQPGSALADARSGFFFCGDEALTQLYLEGLRRAGLTERAAPLRQVVAAAAAGV